MFAVFDGCRFSEETCLEKANSGVCGIMNITIAGSSSHNGLLGVFVVVVVFSHAMI